jgi:hypothetical protein
MRAGVLRPGQNLGQVYSGRHVQFLLVHWFIFEFIPSASLKVCFSKRFPRLAGVQAAIPDESDVSRPVIGFPLDCATAGGCLDSGDMLGALGSLKRLEFVPAGVDIREISFTGENGKGNRGVGPSEF